MMRTTERERRNGLRIYGTWAGDPKGQLEDPTRCIYGVMPNDRAPVEHQCRRKRGHGKGKLYCRLHDPAVVEAKKAAWQKSFDDKFARDEAICAEAKRLARALGVDGEAEYFSAHRVMDSGYRESLVIPFEDVRRLILRLKAKK